MRTNDENKKARSEAGSRCPECGAELEPGAAYCPECGASVQSPDERPPFVSPERGQPGPTPPEEQPPTGRQPVCPPSEQHNPWLLGVGGGLLAVFGLLVLFSGFVLGDLFSLVLGGVMVVVGILLLIGAFRTPTARPT
ncbi:MAG: zinc-ribbon domain-containing protein [Chloroflexota bacterium]